MTAQRPLLEAREIAKTYGHVTALVVCLVID